MNRNGAILWEGASALDGAPIVVVVTGLRKASANSKTGGMLQTFILRTDVAPMDAVNSGADASICGACPHRGTMGARTCYVDVSKAPSAVFRCYQRGNYAQATDLAALGEGRKVRIGTYGDPAAVPVEVWQALVSKAAGHTGYTHQWSHLPARSWAPLVMASADSRGEAAAARLLGYRAFRVAARGDAETLKGEVLCPASAEAGRKVTCDQCMACSGANGRKSSVWIPAHGAKAGRIIAVA